MKAATRFLSVAIITIAALCVPIVSSPPTSVLADETRPPAEDNRDSQVGNGQAEGHPLDPALAVAREGLVHIQATITDYTALMLKRERIKDKLGEYQSMDLKVRCRVEQEGRLIQPMSVYLHFRSPKSVKGREVIWVENRDSGRLVAHEGGYKNLLRVMLKPEGSFAMLGQRYPITEIGIENLIAKLIERGERDRQREGCEVRFFKNSKVDGRVCTLIEVLHPEKQPQFDFYRARIFIDDELQVPIRYAAWSWPAEPGGEPVLEEEYTYRNLRLNVGLTDDDFDPDNPAYNFP